MTSVGAFAAPAAKESLVSYSYEPAPLGPRDVEIEISHCGICHSDLHLIDNDWATSTYPLVPGHEIVGTVSAVGRRAASSRSASASASAGSARPASSASCAAPATRTCAPTQQATCVGQHGRASPSASVPTGASRSPSRRQLDAAATAPLLCGGVTVFAPLRRWGIRVGRDGGRHRDRRARAPGAPLSARDGLPSDRVHVVAGQARRGGCGSGARGRRVLDERARDPGPDEPLRLSALHGARAPRLDHLSADAQAERRPLPRRRAAGPPADPRGAAPVGPARHLRQRHRQPRGHPRDAGVRGGARHRRARSRRRPMADVNARARSACARTAFATGWCSRTDRRRRRQRWSIDAAAPRCADPRRRTTAASCAAGSCRCACAGSARRRAGPPSAARRRAWPRSPHVRRARSASSSASVST